MGTRDHFKVVSGECFSFPLFDPVSRPECAAGVQVKTEIDSTFLQFRKQIVEPVQGLRMKGQRICRLRVQKIVLKMVKADAVITETRHFFDKIIRGFSVQIAGVSHQVRSEETDPSVRSVPENKMSVFFHHNRTVFPRGSIQKS